MTTLNQTRRRIDDALESIEVAVYRLPLAGDHQLEGFGNALATLRGRIYSLRLQGDPHRLDLVDEDPDTERSSK